MVPQRVSSKPDLFSVSLTRVIDLEHPLAVLAGKIDWDALRSAVVECFCDDNGRPASDVRVVLGLLYLKSAFNLSDEQLLHRWVENPYWQWFCGFETMQHQPPIDPTTLSRWRSRLGADRLEHLLAQTIHLAQAEQLLRDKDVREVNVDTTVQPKAIAFPTDSRLYYKMIRTLTRSAQNAEIKLRQSYKRVSKELLVRQGCYARARQSKRANMCQKKLRTILGRVVRDITRKITECRTIVGRVRLDELLVLAQRLLEQTRTSKQKLYSVHEPHVECIAKGKAHKRYEFGCKVSVTVSNRSSWILGVQALHGNPYDGHTLAAQISQVTSFTGREPQHVMVDRGYRGHDYTGPAKVHISGRIPKSATRTLRRMLKRRSAIEPTIGHLKSDHRLERNFLKGKAGDQVNAVLAAIGYNFRKLLRAFGCADFLLLVRLLSLLFRSPRRPTIQFAP